MDARALAGTAAAIGLAAGIGIGYVAFHGGGGKATPTATPAAVTSPAGSSSAADFTLDGKLTLKFVDGSFLWNRGDTNPCAGHGGYDDITQGASVTITDQAGTVIATGSLDAGAATLDSGGAHATACVFTFAVSHVPDGRTFYGVAVSHRGIVQFSADQAKGGQASLSLG